MIFKYTKLLVFYLILVVESFLNFLCAILGYYPALDWSTAFLAWFEFRRVKSVVTQRNSMRGKLEEKASEKMKEAKRIEDGENKKA
tara:strand:+ start:963 stop:1220 length:258 start_codon:yes stop_codon:yes gene_type:complete